MHLFFENVSINMYKHWSGKFFKYEKLNNQAYIISNKDWGNIGQLMNSGRSHIPLEFGRPPRDISKHYNGFKAAEWSNWIVMYSVPFLQNKLPGS
jgi:hypothetical protein